MAYIYRISDQYSILVIVDNNMSAYYVWRNRSQDLYDAPLKILGLNRA